MQQKLVLNVGGNSKTSPLPTHYNGWQHVMLDIDPATQPDVPILGYWCNKKK